MVTRKPNTFKLKLVQQAFDSVLSNAIESRMRFIARGEAPSFREIVVGGVVRIRCDTRTHKVALALLDTQNGTPPRFKPTRDSARGLDGLPFEYLAMSAKQGGSISRYAAARLFDAALAPVAPREPALISVAVRTRAVEILRNRLYGAGFKPALATRWYTKELWKWLLDHPTACLAQQTFGFHLTFLEYNHTVDNLPLIKRVQKETPNLLPLLGWCIREYHGHLSRQSPQKLRNEGLTLQGLETFWKPRGLVATWVTSPADIFSGLRKTLMAGGTGSEPLSEAGWKVLAHMSAQGVRACASFGKMHSTMAKRLNVLAKTGEKDIPLALLRELMLERQTVLVAGSTITEQRIRFVRLAIREARVAKKNGRLRLFLSQEFGLTLDWLNRRGFGESFPGPTSAWASLLRRQAEWHEGVILEASARQGKELWTSLLPAFSLEDVEVVPLISSQELAEEGVSMHHCVGSYVDACLEGGSRIFSLKGPRKQRSTLELVRTAKSGAAPHWSIGQNRGHCNSAPAESLKQAAKVVLRRYQAAQRADAQ